MKNRRFPRKLKMKKKRTKKMKIMKMMMIISIKNLLSQCQL